MGATFVVNVATNLSARFAVGVVGSRETQRCLRGYVHFNVYLKCVANIYTGQVPGYAFADAEVVIMGAFFILWLIR